MSSIEIEIDDDGIRELLKSEEMKEAIDSYAEEIVGRLDKNYKSKSKYTKTRYMAAVYANNRKAISDNMKNNTLLKAVY